MALFYPILGVLILAFLILLGIAITGRVMFACAEEGLEELLCAFRRL
jgi:hypothetical protein